jgi:hypothetical protein
MITLLVETQISSVILSFSLVFFILVLLYRSFAIGFLATIPMVLSTACIYGLMGLLNVAVNTVTVVIVNTCIGIGIDYSIHYVSGYTWVRGLYPDNEKALLATVRTKGSAIMFNTLVVGVGFLVLVFSSFPPLRDFGLFVSLSMLVSSVFALVYLPALFRRLNITRIRTHRPQSEA